MKIAITGGAGNMGKEAVRQVLELSVVEKVRLLFTNKKKNDRIARNLTKKYGTRVEIIRGGLADKDICKRLVEGQDYVVHMAAVIPPLSDNDAEASRLSNMVGSLNLVEAVKTYAPQTKFIHVSTVALYGNRTAAHPWGRVGDPVMPSVFDSYAKHKMIAERAVLESGLSHWVVLRQTGMLHERMLNDNISDGLMFHTPFNSPIEWVSARDSGLLIKRIIERDAAGEIDSFWRKIYDIEGGEENRGTGFDVFRDGFALIGGNAKSFLRPSYNAIRNFHGLWYADGDELNELFGYRHDTVKAYWKEIGDKHKYYKLAKILPASFIAALVIKPLLKHPNSPRTWLKKGDVGKVQAYFGCKDNADALPDDWKDFYVWSEDRGEDVPNDIKNGEFADKYSFMAGYSYEEMKKPEFAKKNGLLLSHGYDETKPVSEWDIEDMKEAAAFRGGECISENMEKGDAYTPLKWRCHDGHEFYAAPYTILKGGYWCPDCCQPEPWNYDKLAKRIPFYAQIWYDSHAKEENRVYRFDENGKTVVERFGKESVV